MTGSFVTNKSCKTLSALAHDEIHEQLNAMVKGQDGAFGRTEHDKGLKHWSQHIKHS